MAVMASPSVDPLAHETKAHDLDLNAKIVNGKNDRETRDIIMDDSPVDNSMSDGIKSIAIASTIDHPPPEQPPLSDTRHDPASPPHSDPMDTEQPDQPADSSANHSAPPLPSHPEQPQPSSPPQDVVMKDSDDLNDSVSPTQNNQLPPLSDDQIDTTVTAVPPANHEDSKQLLLATDSVVDADAALHPSSAISDLAPSFAPYSAREPSPSPSSPVIGQVRPREDEPGTDPAEPITKRAKVEDKGEEEEAEEEALSSRPGSSTAPVPPSDPALNPPPITMPAEVPVAPSSTPLAGLPLPSHPMPTPATDGSAVSYDSKPLTKLQHTRLAESLRKAKKIKDALAFKVPVDVVALNIPNYLNVVQTPMDLSTMEDKLKTGKYPTADDLWADLCLMIHNSVIFNGPDHPVSVAGKNLKAYFAKIMSTLPTGEAAQDAQKRKQSPTPSKTTPARRESTRILKPLPVMTTVSAQSQPTPAAPSSQQKLKSSAPPSATPAALPPTPSESKPQLDSFGTPLIRRESQVDRPKREIVKPVRDLPYASSSKPKKKTAARLDLQFCESVNKELFKHKYKDLMFYFDAPVDTVGLNIPDYHRVIRKPMDFGTVQKKLNEGDYSHANQYLADARLVFENCFTFNGPIDEVHKAGKRLEAVFEELWAKKTEWLIENAPEEESDDESDGEEAISTETALARWTEIGQQVATLNAEAAVLAQIIKSNQSGKSSKRKSKSAKSAGGSISNLASESKKAKRPGLSGGSVKPASSSKPKKSKKMRKLTFDEKQFVSEGIGSLDDINMRKAVQIIRNGVPHLKDVCDDEIELDVEDIPDEVLKELHTFVRSVKKQNGEDVGASDDEYEEAAAASANKSDPTVAYPSAKSRRKNKPMSAREQESKIAQVQQQLGLFQHGSQAANPEESESSEDSGSSSEEE